MTDAIHTIADLEACLGPVSLGAVMKQIDFLDDGAKRWMAASPFAFVGTAGSESLALTLTGGAPGFLEADGTGHMIIPAPSLDDPAGLAEGHGIGLLLLIPGITETLRINGRIAHAGDEIRVAVDEVYVHCGKALIRSEFWAASPVPKAEQGIAAFLARTRFMALGTADAHGRMDVSPKGDPAGAMVRLSGERAVFPDRPGNRRADGFRNMIERPEACALALVPGSNEVVVLSGRTEVSRNADDRAAFAVEGKVPELVTRLAGAVPRLVSSPALERAGLWSSPAVAPGDVDPSAILVGHVKLNKVQGQQADEVRGAVRTETVREGLQLAYQHTLY